VLLVSSTCGLPLSVGIPPTMTSQPKQGTRTGIGQFNLWSWEWWQLVRISVARVSVTRGIWVLERVVAVVVVSKKIVMEGGLSNLSDIVMCVMVVRSARTLEDVQILARGQFNIVLWRILVS